MSRARAVHSTQHCIEGPHDARVHLSPSPQPPAGKSTSLWRTDDARHLQARSRFPRSTSARRTSPRVVHTLRSRDDAVAFLAGATMMPGRPLLGYLVAGFVILA